MSNDPSFKEHIQKMVLSMRNMSGWILRTFQFKRKDVLLTA